MGRRHLLLLLALAGLWGASFMFIKIGVREGFSETSFVALRLLLGTLTLAPIALAAAGARVVGRELRRSAVALAVAATLNSAAPFIVTAWAQTRLDSGETAIIQASAPIFTVLLALRFRRSERVTGARLAGFLVGFGGVGLLVGAQPPHEAVAGVAMVGAAAMYAVGAIYTASRLAETPPLVTAFGTTAAAAAMTLPAGLAQLPSDVPGWKPVVSLLVLGVLGTGIAYVLYYAILAGAGASNAILITYLVPAIALVYGVTLLGEPLTAARVGGFVLVVAGVALGTGAVRSSRRRRAEEQLASAP